MLASTNHYRLVLGSDSLHNGSNGNGITGLTSCMSTLVDGFAPPGSSAAAADAADSVGCSVATPVRSLLANCARRERVSFSRCCDTCAQRDVALKASFL